MKKFNQNEKVGFGKKLLIAGVLCVAAALCISGYNLISDYQAGRFTQTVVADIKEYLDPSETAPAATEDEAPQFSADADDTHTAAAVFQGYSFIGYLTVPKLGLELPVMSDWNYDKLNISPCRYTGSIYTDDLVIAAHNYDSHFGRLNQLERGDEVQFTDMTGHTYVYQVVLTDTLEPVEINKMTSGAYDLSLFTCNFSGTARVTVRCERKV